MPPRKRKSRAPEVPQEPEVVQPAQPDPEPQQLVPEPVETEQTLEVDPVIEEQPVVEEDPVIEEEMLEDKAEEHNQDGEGEPADDMEEHQNDVVSENPEKAEQDGETNQMPIENANPVNGGEAEEEQNEEIEDELEEEPLEKILEPFSKDQLTLLIKEAVSKHPDLLEDVHKLADSDPAHCKIFVFGLGWEATDETVTSVFGKYGEIKDCKVVKDKNTGKSKGYCFILFKNRNGARRALKEPQKMIDGRMTSCQLASAGPVQTTPTPSAVAAVSSPPASEYTQKKIYVSNVSAELDPNKLLEFFSKFGEIEEGPLGLDKQTGKPRGFCLFVYKSVQSAKKALEEPHKSFEGQMLHCQKAVDGPKHTKGHFNQQHSQPHQHHHQKGYHHHPAKKGRYSGSSGGAGHTGGHLMAPSGGPSVPPVGFNPAVAPAAIGQAVAALLSGQGLGGYGGGMNPQGVPPMMNNPGYGGQGGAGGYGGQPGMQGGYGGQPQMGPGGVRPYQGGGPYMGRGH